MDSKGAYAVRDQASVPVVVKVVKNSDHHLYWDNPEEFAEAIVECVEELDGRVAGREEGLTLGI
jgi:pimeloyl-ACP methyl ester carboxylesterase